MNNLSEIPRFPESPLNQVQFKKIANPLRALAQSTPVEAGNEIWFLTLSDLLMLLMIFFVLLLGITLKQQSNPAAPQALRTKATPPVAAIKEQAAIQQTSDSQVSNATASLESDLLDIVDDHQGLQGITVVRHAQHVVLTFPERIIFDSGQAQLKPAVLPKLQQIAVFIRNHSNLQLEIQGHTDNRPISNRRYPSNWELSADRATQVAKSLVGLGVNPAKISTKGFGEYQPLYSNDSESERLKNRRVELQFSLSPLS